MAESAQSPLSRRSPAQEAASGPGVLESVDSVSAITGTPSPDLSLVDRLTELRIPEGNDNDEGGACSLPTTKNVGIGLLRSKGVSEDKIKKLFADPVLVLARERLATLAARKHDLLLDADNLHKYTVTEFPGFTVAMIDNDTTRVQRHQLSGLCYMHAPIVVQYYSIWHWKLLNHRGRKAHELDRHDMIDLTAYIPHHFGDEAFEDYIFKDAGRQSIDALKHILEPGSVVQTITPRHAAEYLRLYGPGLVSRFNVREQFKNNKECHHHHGLVDHSDPPVGYHAMALVGVREMAGVRYFLLQNWWREKQFVEVDEDYLVSCEAVLSFVITPQTRVPNTFPTKVGSIMETENLHLAEKLAPEMGV